MQTTRKVNFLWSAAPLSPFADELLDLLFMYLGFFCLFATGAEGVKPGADQENDGRERQC